MNSLRQASLLCSSLLGYKRQLLPKFTVISRSILHGYKHHLVPSLLVIPRTVSPIRGFSDFVFPMSWKQKVLKSKNRMNDACGPLIENKVVKSLMKFPIINQTVDVFVAIVQFGLTIYFLAVGRIAVVFLKDARYSASRFGGWTTSYSLKFLTWGDMSFISRKFKSFKDRKALYKYILVNKIHVKMSRYVRLKTPLDLNYWDFPEEGVYKLNFDASVKKGRGGIGFVIRDWFGNVIDDGFALTLTTSSTEAEVTALIRGLERAKLLKIKKIVVEGDCNSTTNCLLFKNYHPHFDSNRTAWELLRSFESYEVRWVCRGKNAVADVLSKVGREHGDKFGKVGCIASPHVPEGKNYYPFVDHEKSNEPHVHFDF